MKECTKCKEKKELTEFYLRGPEKKPGSACKKCNSITNKKTYKVRGEEIKINCWKRGIKKKFNFTPEKYNNMFSEQDGKCLICNKLSPNKKLSIDHCHNTGRIRGLLCSLCNLAIGYFKDDTKILQKAIDYLSSPSPLKQEEVPE